MKAHSANLNYAEETQLFFYLKKAYINHKRIDDVLYHREGCSLFRLFIVSLKIKSKNAINAAEGLFSNRQIQKLVER